MERIDYELRDQQLNEDKNRPFTEENRRAMSAALQDLEQAEIATFREVVDITLTDLLMVKTSVKVDSPLFGVSDDDVRVILRRYRKGTFYDDATEQAIHDMMCLALTCYRCDIKWLTGVSPETPFYIIAQAHIRLLGLGLCEFQMADTRSISGGSTKDIQKQIKAVYALPEWFVSSCENYLSEFSLFHSSKFAFSADSDPRPFHAIWEVPYYLYAYESMGIMRSVSVSRGDPLRLYKISSEERLHLSEHAIRDIEACSNDIETWEIYLPANI